MRATHTFTTGDTVFTGGIKSDYTFNLSAENTIGTINVEADLVLVQRRVDARFGRWPDRQPH